MSAWITRIGGLGTAFTAWVLPLTVLASGATATDIAPRKAAVPPVALLEQPLIDAVATRGCENYPYAEPAAFSSGEAILRSDLKRGLQIGLQCLAGNGPMGYLHRYHTEQAGRLADLLASPQTKTLQCVEDKMFATAVATSPNGTSLDDPLYSVLHEARYPAIILDTYRLGGILSRRYDDQTYRSFFHLRDDQILEHRNGQPLRPANLHRYQNRPALMFHEMVHWLGHEHSAIYPDLAHLYETCCFGGSDYISDADRNHDHQQTACMILKDDELWRAGGQPYKQMRIWHHKGYDRLKGEMRNDYDS